LTPLCKAAGINENFAVNTTAIDTQGAEVKSARAPLDFNTTYLELEAEKVMER
jgi:hypothetical protein